jgi:5'-3' exonuclease
MKRLIIDGNNLVHRTYWVAKNQPKFNEHFHIYLFLTSVKNYVQQYQADEVYCAWDEKVDYQVNKRKTLLEEYKGTRDQERNKEVHSKNNIIKELLQHLGIRSIIPKSYEADDVIAIFNSLFPDDERIIVSVDKDFCQLIDDGTVVYDPIRKIEYNKNNFEEAVGCKRENFVAMKALTGDKSDNIPGVKGFGKVKLAKFFNGECSLTEQEQEHYNRNIKLVDLSLTLNDGDEVQHVSEQINKEIERDFTSFKEQCEKLQFNQIIKNIDEWYNIFFIRSKLRDLLSY